MKATTVTVLLMLASPPSAAGKREFNAATDVIVLGKVETLKSEPLGDLVLDGAFTARLTITRVIRGRPPSSILTIKYIAHQDRPSNAIGRYHLRRSKDGIWLSCGEAGERGYICR